MAEVSTEETPVEQQGLLSYSQVAKDLFPGKFHGELPPAEEPEEAPAEKPEVDEEGAPDDTSTDDVEETSEASDDETPETISSVSELIEHYELDPEWVDELVVTGKVDGEEVAYKLGDLRANAQMYSAADKRLEKAKERAEAQTQELTQRAAALQQQFEAAATLINRAEDVLAEEDKAIDWDGLRKDDPAEYSAKREEMRVRKERIEALKQEGAQAYQQHQLKRQQELQQLQAKYLSDEHDKLLAAIPEWGDEKKREAGKAELGQYLSSELEDQRLIGSVASNHRLIILARKAMLYDQGQSGKEVAQKRLRKVPKTLKPGASKPQEQVSKERVETLRAQAQKSGKADDAIAFLREKRKRG